MSGIGTDIERNRTCLPPSGKGGTTLEVLMRGRGGIVDAGSSAKAREDVEGMVAERVGCGRGVAVTDDDLRRCGWVGGLAKSGVAEGGVGEGETLDAERDGGGALPTKVRYSYLSRIYFSN